MGTAGALLLASAGYAAGSRNAGLRGLGNDALVGESILTATAFDSYYKNTIKGLSCFEVLQANNVIMGTGTAATLYKDEVTEMKTWYTSAHTVASVKSAAQQTMQAGVEQRCSALATSTPSSGKSGTAAPSSPISSYSEFGHLYSIETRGKTWPEIEDIDRLVRQKKDFDDN